MNKRIKNVLVHGMELTDEQKKAIEAHIEANINPQVEAANDELTAQVVKLLSEYNARTGMHIHGIHVVYMDDADGKPVPVESSVEGYTDVAKEDVPGLNTVH